MSSQDAERAGSTGPRGFIRGPQSFACGIVLLALALFALWASDNLTQGTLRAMGPAMLPRVLAVGVGICGIALIATGLLVDGEPLEGWSLRGPVFVAAAILAFALTIRTIGFAVAGPLTILISGFASPESRWKESIVFALLMTAFCVGLFRYALNQPMPILIIPGVIYI
jgi:putative tricarboxylic transport membrane protein